MVYVRYITDRKLGSDNKLQVPSVIISLANKFIENGGCKGLNVSKYEACKLRIYLNLTDNGINENRIPQATRIAIGYMQEYKFISQIARFCGSVIRGPDNPEENSKIGDFSVDGRNCDVKVAKSDDLLGAVDAKSNYNFDINGYYLCLNLAGDKMYIIEHSALLNVFLPSKNGNKGFYLEKYAQWVTRTDQYTVSGTPHPNFIGSSDIDAKIGNGSLYSYSIDQLCSD